MGPFDLKFFISSHKFRSRLRTTSKKYMVVEIDGFKFESGLWLFLVTAWRPVILLLLASVSSFAQCG